MDVRFTVTRFSAGYDMRDVDEFLDRCDRALELRDGSVSAQDVLQARFSSVRFGQGYDVEEVDAFLDEVLAPRIEAAGRGEDDSPLGGVPTAGAAPAGTAPAGAAPAGTALGRTALGRTATAGSGASAGPTVQEPARGGHPAERRPGLLSRLLGRNR